MEDKMKLKNLLKKVLCFGVAASLSMSMMPALTASAAAYPTVDMFEHVKAINGTYAAFKGVHGIFDSNAYVHTDSTGTHSGSHSFANTHLDEMIFTGPVNGAEAFDFEGKTYYFNFSPIEGFVQLCNSQNVTCNIQFMLRWDGSADKAYLVDPQARVVNPNAAVASHQMYAMDTTGEGRQTYRAFWRALMQWCANKGYHIDQLILGNEVNAPNTWNYFGTTDVNTCTQKYAISFFDMYQAVREYSTTSRCSVCLDHSWTWNENGAMISTKDFLDNFHAKVTALNGGASVDWCLAMHIWPARLDHPAIWTRWNGLALATNSANTFYVDGTNLNVMTDYIKNNFGAQHRIMMTEQGFVSTQGEQVQAASLAYTYYACLYNDMVDSFMLFDQNGDGMMAALMPLAQQVYTRISSADQADHDWIASVCLPVIGVSSWSQIIPNFGVISATAPVIPTTPTTPTVPTTPVATETPSVPSVPSTGDLSQLKASFDEHYYADTYPDLKAVFGYDREALWNHYVTSGYSEGRVMQNPSGTTAPVAPTTPTTPTAPTTPTTSVVSSNGQLNAIFDEHYYADQNPDLKAVFGYDRAALWNHYITCGLNEGRVMNSKLDVVKYKNTYADLSAAFGNNWDAYVEHYLTVGINEGRDSGMAK